VIAGDSSHPQIADATAPFNYVRIMGTTPAQKLGYSKETLELWAARAKAWASGDQAPGLDCIASQHSKDTARDVYLYVISGHKVSNPAAAMALIEALP
jgi:uncharacterized protein YecE (DUF72 family)